MAKQTTPKPPEQPTPTLAPEPQQPPKPRQGDDAPIALGITSLLIWMTMPLIGSIIGIVIAAVGLNEAKKQHGRGHGLNLAALITNISLTVLQFCALVAIILFVFFGIAVSSAGQDYYQDEQSISESSFQDRDQQHT